MHHTYSNMIMASPSANSSIGQTRNCRNWQALLCSIFILSLMINLPFTVLKSLRKNTESPCKEGLTNSIPHFLRWPGDITCTDFSGVRIPLAVFFPARRTQLRCWDGGGVSRVKAMDIECIVFNNAGNSPGHSRPTKYQNH